MLYDSLFDVANPDLDLLPQMSAQVFFVAGSAKKVPLVPVAALRPARGGSTADDGSKRYRVRVMENGAVVERTIVVGVMSRVMAEVKSGLKPGDDVVVSDTPPTARPTKPQGGGGGARGVGTPKL